METHRFDIISFAFGAVFLAITASILWDLNFEFAYGDWIFPLAILVIGVALLTSAIRASIKRP